MTAKEFFEQEVNESILNFQTFQEMTNQKDEIIWLMEDFALFICRKQREIDGKYLQEFHTNEKVDSHIINELVIKSPLYYAA